MKALIFTHHYLDGNSGGSFASRAYINAFSEIADSCKLLYPDRGIPITDYIHKKCILKGIQNKHNNIQKVIDVYKGRLHRYSDVMIPQILEFNPDVVVFDNSRTTAGMLKEIKKLGFKTIVIHHNYEMEYYRGTKPFIGWRLPFMYYMEEAERTAVQNSSLNLTLTEEDVNLLQLHYDPQKLKRIVKLGSFESITVKESINTKVNAKRNNLNSNLCFVITGTLSTYQTEISVIPFLRNEYPELMKLLPNSTLIIAGQNPSKKMIKACANYPSITLIPNPENMQDVIRLADVYICPTSVGGGLKLRVMDGLKAGLPVLTHIVSARGYDEFVKAKCMFTYESKATFKQSLEKLINEINIGNLNSTTIKNIYNSVFSFEAGVKRLKEIMYQNEMI